MNQKLPFAFTIFNKLSYKLTRISSDTGIGRRKPAVDCYCFHRCIIAASIFSGELIALFTMTSIVIKKFYEN